MRISEHLEWMKIWLEDVRPDINVQITIPSSEVQTETLQIQLLTDKPTPQTSSVWHTTRTFSLTYITDQEERLWNVMEDVQEKSYQSRYIRSSFSEASSYIESFQIGRPLRREDGLLELDAELVSSVLRKIPQESVSKMEHLYTRFQ